MSASPDPQHLTWPFFEAAHRARNDRIVTRSRGMIHINAADRRMSRLAEQDWLPAFSRLEAVWANGEVNTVNDSIADHGRPEEEVLVHDISDEAIEAAAGKSGVAAPTPTYWTSSCYAACCQM